jgi:hypothetical protein
MLKHNRKRNSGLAYEFLARRCARALVEGDGGALEAGRSLLLRHFSPDCPMSQELELFRALGSCRGLSTEGVRRIIEEVRSRSSELDVEALEEQRKDFIREVHETFGQDFFSERVPDYKYLASVQIVLESVRGSSRPLEKAEAVRVEETLVEHLSGRRKVDQEDPLPRIDENTYALSVRKFHERHRERLDPEQWEVLREHARARISGDRVQLRELVLEERARILGRLRSARRMDEFKNDRIMAERLEQAISRLEGAPTTPDDDTVRDVLLYQRLCKELDS